ncbi:MAG: serine dehydratase [Gammaproteobacteria bacterium SG8_31]|jgi:threonine dehydratase|nr:MAG: serine dehydratase [Gammaproteobacteria bacterium SG8_31]
MRDAQLPAGWQPPTAADVRAAARTIAGRVHRTPVLHCAALDELVSGRVFLKCENLQRIGAFKARGAMNAVWALSEEEARRGVATHSSGNHGAAVALAASSRGIPSWVVIPDDAPRVKQQSVAREGGEVVPCRPGLAARETGLADVVAQTGAVVIHPYDDDRVIAGQGTAALELLADAPCLDAVLVPIGGGGLVSGTAVVAKDHRASPRVIACEPGGADDARRSFIAGRRIAVDSPDTIADGLRATIGVRNFAMVSELVDDVLTVSDEAIIRAMRLIWERLRIVVEPSAAVPVAVLLEGVYRPEGESIGVILSGGNVDLDHLPWRQSTPG